MYKKIRTITITEYQNEDMELYKLEAQCSGKSISSLYSEQAKWSYKERFGRDISPMIIEKLLVELLDKNIEIIDGEKIYEHEKE